MYDIAIDFDSFEEAAECIAELKKTDEYDKLGWRVAGI